MKLNFNSTDEKPLPELEGFYEEFLQKRLTELQVLHTALQSQNLSVVAHLAHQWKGFCAPYGFAQLGLLATELEAHVSDGNHDECHLVVDRMRTYLTEKARRLRA